MSRSGRDPTCGLRVKLANLRVDPEQHERWKVAARDAGLSWSEWARNVLDIAAGPRKVASKTKTVVAPVRKRLRSTGPAPTKPPPKRPDSEAASGGKRSYSPDPK